MDEREFAPAFRSHALSRSRQLILFSLDAYARQPRATLNGFVWAQLLVVRHSAGHWRL